MKMKNWIFVLVLLMLAFAAGCAAEPTPYEVNDGDNYTVTVCYDANGGVFTTNTTVITDSYNISGMSTNAEGKVELPLCQPDDPVRGKNAFKAERNGYFLAGWYAQRKGAEGAYTYSDKWDFSTRRFEVEPAGSYSAAEPALTLYAAWVPYYEIECYDLATGEKLDTLVYDPTDGEQKLPQWNQETGTLTMNGFPERDGFTFNGAYLDAEGKQSIETETIHHTAQLDEATATVSGGTMKVYVDWLEGEWYHIYNADQFLKNASVRGNYIIHNDLDFEGKNWSTNLMHGNYTGTIVGNGHTFRNISFAQTDNSKTNAGLFGYLTATAKLENITFENVSFTVQNGTRVAGTGYGLLAGTVAETAKLENVQIRNSVLLINSGCYFATEDYSIGLVCGMGDTDIDPAGITCEATGDAPETVVITVHESTVTVEFVTE